MDQVMDQEKNKAKDPEIGEEGYLNQNCWMVNNTNRSPYGRCRYCDSKFQNCLFLQYQAVSFVSASVLLAVSFLIDRNILTSVAVCIIALIAVNGYFFNRSTDNLIRAYFTEKKARQASEKLTKILQAQEEDLTRFYRLSVGRELRMAELKERIKKLETDKNTEVQ